MKNNNPSDLLRQLAGEGSDYYIGSGAAVTTKKFTHIEIGADGATLTDVKIRGVSVKAARNYPDTVPAGYLMCAGGDDYFDSIELSAGWAQGALLLEDPDISIDSVTVATGVAGAAMAPVIQFDNTGNAGSLEVEYKLKDGAGDVVASKGRDTGNAIRLYFLGGSNVTVALPGLVYPAVGEGYTFEVNVIAMNGSESDEFTASEAFNVTES